MLYRAELDANDFVPLYESKNPIVGVASAPDGSKVAVMEQSKAAGGSLAMTIVVLDRKGGELHRHRHAGSYPESSVVVLNVQTLTFLDGNRLRYEVYRSGDDFALGNREVRVIETGSGLIERQPNRTQHPKGPVVRVTPEEELYVTGSKGEPVYLGPRYYRHTWAPGTGQLIYTLGANFQLAPDIWLYDAGGGASRWLGTGTVLDWVGDSLLLWSQSEREAGEFGGVLE